MNAVPDTEIVNLPEPTEDPWIESREGMLFFANALLIFPEISAYFPLLLGRFLKFVGVAPGLQEILGIIPEIAALALPYAGIFFLVPLWFALKSRSETTCPRARWALLLFAALHASFVLSAVLFWTTGRIFPQV